MGIVIAREGFATLCGVPVIIIIQSYLIRSERHSTAAPGTRPQTAVVALMADTIGELRLVADLADGAALAAVARWRHLFPFFDAFLHRRFVVLKVVLEISAHRIRIMRRV